MYSVSAHTCAASLLSDLGTPLCIHVLQRNALVLLAILDELSAHRVLALKVLVPALHVLPACQRGASDFTLLTLQPESGRRACREADPVE